MKNLFTFAIAAMFVAAPMTASAQEEVEELDLTPDMFMNYQDPENPKAMDENAIEYHIGEVLGGGALVIGTGSLWEWCYVDISGWDKLIFTTNGGFPRVFMNRIVADGQCADTFDPNTNAIDGNKPWVQERYYTTSEDGTIYTVDLKKLVADYGFAWLHGVKCNWGAELQVDAILLQKGGSTGITTTLKDAIEGKTVSLSGQTVGKNYKGIVIKNGKKFVQ
ncbi:MAG: hypothetical protein Q4F85_01180 [Prevotella sp.]|nr:hypothetical protein [Prevotella sp.]